MTKDSLIQKNSPYISPTPGEIPIVASTIWSAVNSIIPIEILRKVKECGFNAAFCVLGDSVVSTSLNNASTAGIKLLIYNVLLTEVATGSSREPTTSSPPSAVNFVNKYKNHKALGGWNLRDEPTYNDLADTTTPGSLSRIFNTIKAADPNHLLYINLVGAPTVAHMNGKTYEQYLNIFQKNFGPPVWSYDLYPISQKDFLLLSDKDGVNGEVSVSHERFYQDFELFSKKAKDTGIPFWAHCQSMEVVTGTTFYKPMALEQYIRFEAFSALAYGAQGLVYWTYKERGFGYTKNGEIHYSPELHLSALRNRDDTTLPYWYYAKRVNEEIKKYRHVFFGAQLQKACHLVKVYPGCQPMSSPLGAVNYISAKGEGVLLTHLKNNGIDYFVIVSHDPVNYQDITIFLKTGAQVKELTPTKSGGNAPAGYMSTSTSGVPRTLIPGGYMILQWMNA